ncbi:uncharacterized protein K441DRAFT_730330 [Cenococcum geophilum 1.58]|uniref:uncharacterized protein n=1 Tax=Cenococcum geophilum 1.58 TaxID=794803 RepID=UPI00358F5506|nr:hypothetical protein K441DRAFT_730330 [Cenococcum geophilum 1.58]
MPTSTPTRHDEVHPRKPLESQQNAGGDMSMMFFARSQSLRELPSSEEQQIKGLNVETIAEILFPPPTWITSPEYWALRANSEHDDSNLAFFSLNLSMYQQTLVASEWEDMWFFMYGRVHPYALTWEVKLDDSQATGDDLANYTIPALIVRDQGYQPVTPRMFDIADTFPIASPIVSFTGLVIGSGHTLLNDEAGLEDIQLKCCAFIQLSTYLTPGNPSKTPFKGFHPFQVFIIFPIHLKPWLLLCKKLIDKRETHFQSNTLFFCTGKVAGFLNHRIMIHPPQLTQDKIFIIVPDTWDFFKKAGRDSISTSPLVTTPAKQPFTNPSGRAKFMSPSNRATQQAITPTMSIISSTGQTSRTESTRLTPCSSTPTAYSTSSSITTLNTYTTPPSKRSNEYDSTGSSVWVMSMRRAA